MSSLNPSELLAEKSLWQVWRVARQIPRKKFNQICWYLSVVILVGYATCTKQSSAEIAEMVRAWVAIGLDFAGTILGFLVAGFTVFATLSKPAMFVKMATMKEPRSGLSWLKYNIGVFFETFIWYVGFVMLCFVVLVLGARGGAIVQVIHLFPTDWVPRTTDIICRVSIVAVASGFSALCLELKSFIFNIYQIVLTSIRWEFEYGDNRVVQKPERADGARPVQR